MSRILVVVMVLVLAAAPASAGTSVVDKTVSSATSRVETEELVQRYFSTWRSYGLVATASMFSPLSTQRVGDVMRRLLASLPAERAEPLIAAMFGDDVGPDDIKGFDDRRMLAAFFQMTDLTLRRHGAAPKLAEYEYLGQVEENPTLIHAVVRTTIKTSKAEATRVSLYGLKRVGGKWYMAMLDSMLGAIENMEKQINGG